MNADGIHGDHSNIIPQIMAENHVKCRLMPNIDVEFLLPNFFIILIPSH